jgi:hypothetical protein
MLFTMYCTRQGTYFDATVGGGGDEIGLAPALYLDQVHLRP